MGSPQCPPLPGLCSLVATAPHPVMPLQAQGLTYPSTTSIPIFGVRGGSSVGRAPGLQPGGRGFESHPLHSTSDSICPPPIGCRILEVRLVASAWVPSRRAALGSLVHSLADVADEPEAGLDDSLIGDEIALFGCFHRLVVTTKELAEQRRQAVLLVAWSL